MLIEYTDLKTETIRVPAGSIDTDSSSDLNVIYLALVYTNELYYGQGNLLDDLSSGKKHEVETAAWLCNTYWEAAKRAYAYIHPGRMIPVDETVEYSYAIEDADYVEVPEAYIYPNEWSSVRFAKLFKRLLIEFGHSYTDLYTNLMSKNKERVVAAAEIMNKYGAMAERLL